MKKLKGKDLHRLSVEGFKRAKKTPIIVVLSDIRSLNNVGSVFRTCDAFLIEKIYLCGITPTPPHRDIRKTALGATDTVDWEYVKNTSHLLQELEKQHIDVIAVEQVSGATSLETFNPTPYHKTALIFGNEVYGISQELIYQCKEVIEIPQLGSKHSLNISISVGVVLWDLLCKLR